MNKIKGSVLRTTCLLAAGFTWLMACGGSVEGRVQTDGAMSPMDGGPRVPGKDAGDAGDASDSGDVSDSGASGPKLTAKARDGVELSAICPSGQTCTWSIQSHPGGASSGVFSDVNGETTTFLPNTHGVFVLRFADESMKFTDYTVTFTCDRPIPYYPAGCLDQLESDANTVAEMAGVSDRYPTLGTDILPALPTLPTVTEREHLVEVADAMALDAACNSTGRYIKLTADIMAQVQCIGSNLIIDLNGHVLSELGSANIGGGLRQTEVRGPGRLGAFVHAQRFAVEDIVLRFLIIGGEDVIEAPGGIGQQLAPANRWLVVNSVIIGHDASAPGTQSNSPMLMTESYDLIFANVNAFVPNKLPQQDSDSGWAARIAGDRLLFVDTMLRAEYNRVVRRGPGGVSVNGYSMYSSVWARGTPRQATQIALQQAYTDTDMDTISTDRALNLFVRYEVDNLFTNNGLIGAHPSDPSGLWLAHGAEVRTSQSGFFGQEQWAGQQAQCNPGKICNYDVGGRNVYIENLPDPLVHTPPPEITDPVLGTLAESNPDAITDLAP